MYNIQHTTISNIKSTSSSSSSVLLLTGVVVELLRERDLLMVIDDGTGLLSLNVSSFSGVLLHLGAAVDAFVSYNNISKSCDLCDLRILIDPNLECLRVVETTNMTVNMPVNSALLHNQFPITIDANLDEGEVMRLVAAANSNGISLLNLCASVQRSPMCVNKILEDLVGNYQIYKEEDKWKAL